MQKIGRREFVKSAAFAAAGVSIVPRHVLGGVGFRAPSDTLNVAAIGAGGMGASNMAELTSQNIVAIADVDFDRVAGSLLDRSGNVRDDRRALKAAYEKAKRYSDFREMLDQEPGIDAVVIATPDHVHAVAANQAMKMGKHVYVQKPLTWSVKEARVLRETAKETGVVTQMGNQGHSHDDGRRLLEWVWAGAIGPVSEVHVWTNRPIWPQGIDRPAETPPVPDHLDWDLFLGPAPKVPYNPAYHPFAWRGWLDYGVGALGDMGAHLIDHAYWALGLDYPTKVWASGTPFGGERGAPASWPLATTVYYDFVQADGSPLKMTWYDGGLLPPRPPQYPDNVEMNPTGGTIMVGTKGILVYDTYGHNPRMYPQDLEQQYADVPKTLTRIDVSHEMNWANACMGEGEATCPFDYAAPLTETMLLGLVALRAGKPITYNGAEMRIPNAPEAEQYLHREYRAGWAL